MTKDLLHFAQSDSERIRHLSALKAIYEIYPDLTEKSIQSCLSNAIRSVGDSEWHKVIEYIHSIPVSWDLLEEAEQIKAVQYIQSINPESVRVIANAVQIESLKKFALSKMNDIPKQLFGEFVKISPIQEATELAINYFSTARSFNASFAYFRDMILPLSLLFSKEQIRQIIVAFTQNRQISGSGGMDQLYAEFYRLTNKISKEFKTEWEEIYQYYLKWQYGEELQQLLLSEFPEFDTSGKVGD